MICQSKKIILKLMNSKKAKTSMDQLFVKHGIGQSEFW